MKLLILGTSNAILRNGWVAGLRAALPEAEITNLSIGASPGLQFSWLLGQDLSAYDVVFFDSVPNDEKLAQEAPIDDAEWITYEILSTIAARTRLILLGIPLDAFVFGEPSAVYLQRVAFAELLRAQFVSLRTIVRRYGRGIVGAGVPLYETVAHPDQKIAYESGLEIGRQLALYIAETPKTVETEDFASNFTCLDAADLPVEGAEVVVRQNRMLSARLLEMRPGSRIDFDQAGRCIGFYFNALGSRCMLELGGADGSAVERRCWYDSTPALIEMRFEPIGRPFARLGVLDRWLGGVGLVPGKGTFDYSEPAPRLQIGRTVFWSGVGGSLPTPAARQHDAFQMQRRIEAALGMRFEESESCHEDDVGVEALLQTRRLDAIYRAYRRELPEKLDDAAWLWDGAKVCIKARQAETAAAFLDARLSLMPDDAATLKERGVVSQILKDRKAAIIFYEKSLAARPAQSDVLRETGRLHLDEGKAAVAVDLLGRAHALDGSDGTTSYLLGKGLVALHRFDEAIAVLAAARRSQPESFAVVYQLGLAHYGKRDLAAARELLSRAHALQPGNVSAINGLARILNAEGDYRGAMDFLESRLDLAAQGSVDTCLIYAKAAQSVGAFDKAVRAVERAETLRPNYPGIADMVARARAKAGQAKPS